MDDISLSIPQLPTARAFQKRSRPQQLTLFRSLHAEALQATASEGLAHSPYVTATAGFEPRPSSRKASTLPMRHHAHTTTITTTNTTPLQQLLLLLLLTDNNKYQCR